MSVPTSLSETRSLALLGAVSVLIAVTACSTVREVNFNPAALAVRPELAGVAPAPARATDAQDYKLRTSSPDRIRLVLRAGADQAGLAPAVRDLIHLRVARLLRFPDVDLIEAPEASGETPPTLEYLQGVQADAVAILSTRRVADNVVAHLELKDPVDGTTYGEYDQGVEVVEEGVDPAHQAELYRDKRAGRNAFVTVTSGPQVSLRNESRDSLRELVLASVSGRISVQSTAPGAVVSVLGPEKNARRDLGPAPLRDVRLREGLHRLEIRRAGYEPMERQVQVRAGRGQELFVRWPDDRESTALAVVSAPVGQRVSIDGVVQGLTPLYVTNIEPGAYGLELSRGTEGGAYQVTGEDRVELGAGEVTGRAFLIRYDESFGPDLLKSDVFETVVSADQEVGEDNQEVGKDKQQGDTGGAEATPVEYVSDGGLGFRTTLNGSAWLGLRSQPLVLDSFDMTLLVRQAEGNVLTFGLLSDTQESVVVYVEGKTYTVARWTGPTPASSKSFETTRTREGSLYPVRLRYERAENRLTVEIDGTAVYEGPYAGGRVGRLVLLTQPAAADGRALAKSLRIRTGAGLYDKD